MHMSTHNVGMIQTSFLGVYLMVLCLALHLIEPDVCETLGMDFITSTSLSKKMYSAAQACLLYDEYLGSHSLEHLQCLMYVSTCS